MLRETVYEGQLCHIRTRGRWGDLEDQYLEPILSATMIRKNDQVISRLGIVYEHFLLSPPQRPRDLEPLTGHVMASCGCERGAVTFPAPTDPGPLPRENKNNIQG